MAISVNWPTKVISVPKNYLTLIEGVRYELDVDQFRLDLRSLEDDAEGMPFLRTHKHSTETTIGGVTYARLIEIINDYTVTFEDGQYIVELAGANNNILEKTNYNQVSVREKNSAGLITVSSGSGLSEEQDQMLTDIDTETTDLATDIDGLQSDVGDIHTETTDLASDIAALQAQIDEIHERFALNTERPVIHSEDGIDSTNIDINITDNGDGTFTEERQ